MFPSLYFNSNCSICSSLENPLASWTDPLPCHSTHLRHPCPLSLCPIEVYCIVCHPWTEDDTHFLQHVFLQQPSTHFQVGWKEWALTQIHSKRDLKRTYLKRQTLRYLRIRSERPDYTILKEVLKMACPTSSGVLNEVYKLAGDWWKARLRGGAGEMRTKCAVF